MENRIERAKDLFRKGYNCCQAVACAFEDLYSINHNDLINICSSFGGGMGRLREVCGALSGAFVALGLLYGYGEDNSKKREHYALIKETGKKFEKENGSMICAELLNIKAPADKEKLEQIQSKQHSCVELVGIATNIVQEIILQKNIS